MPLERDFQATLIKEIKRLLPGCMVLKNDADYIQGIPDLTVLYRNHWAYLEVKKSPHEPYRPNQEHYLDWASRNSYSSTIYPENKDQVLNELQQALRALRSSCVFKS